MKTLTILLLLSASAQAVTITQLASIMSIAASAETIVKTVRHPKAAAKEAGRKLRDAAKGKQ